MTLLQSPSNIYSMEELYSGHDWRIVMEEATLPDGRTKKVARAYRPDSVHLIAFTEGGKILLLREYRPFYKDYIWMLPSGRVDKEADHEAGAQRELQEETGFKARELKHLWTTHHSESLNYSNHIYTATGLEESPLPQDDDEMIEVHEVSLDEAIEKVLSSKIVHTASAYALLRYEREFLYGKPSL